jgi:hypothetical protein
MRVLVVVLPACFVILVVLQHPAGAEAPWAGRVDPPYVLDGDPEYPYVSAARAAHWNRHASVDRVTSARCEPELIHGEQLVRRPFLQVLVSWFCNGLTERSRP